VLHRGVSENVGSKISAKIALRALVFVDLFWFVIVAAEIGLALGTVLVGLGEAVVFGVGFLFDVPDC